MRGRFSIVSLSFVFALLQAVLMARVAFSAAVPHRTVEMTPVAAEGELAKELGRYAEATGSDMVTTVNYHNSGSL